MVVWAIVERDELLQFENETFRLLPKLLQLFSLLKLSSAEVDSSDENSVCVVTSVIEGSGAILMLARDKSLGMKDKKPPE